MIFEIYQDADGKHRWRLLSAKGELMATSEPFDGAPIAAGALSAMLNAIVEDEYEIERHD